MANKIFLTSALAMGFVAPAMAEMTDSNTFPDASQGEYMQANTRYIGAATSDNMDSVYEGSVDAVAEYEDVLYQIAAGKYLPAGAESPIDCNVAGSFCAGVQNGVYYDANNNQGLTSCSTATNGAYTLSDGTGNSINSCYRECTNSDVEHSKGTMNGGYYYGNNNQCEPTDCVDGWHVKAGAIASTIGTVAGENSAYVSASGYFSEANYNGNGAKGQSYYGLTDNNTWAVDYGSSKGVLIGQARCSTQSGQGAWDWSTNSAQNPTITSNLTDETGQEGAQYCYCNVTGYTPNGGTLQSLSSSWVFRYDFGGASGCASYCTYNCADSMRSAYSASLAFRAAVLGSAVGALPAICEANTININWGDTDAADVTANNAGTATYGSDVRTPVKARAKKGFRFNGWRFSKPEQTTTK